MINFLHTYTPSSVLLKYSFITIHWYGLMIALGAILGLLAVIKLAKHYNIDKVLIYDFLFYATIVSILSARFYYVIYNWAYYSENLNSVYRIWEGGLAIHGAIIGALLVLYVFAKKHSINLWKFLDILVIGLIIGQIFGRWGNYFNQELFGAPTELSFGIPIEPQFRPTNLKEFSYFHPTFLYESILNFFLLLWMLGLHAINKSKGKIKAGTIALVYFIGYSLIRIFTETLRVDYTPFVFGIRWAQIISGIIIVISVTLLLFKYLKKK